LLRKQNIAAVSHQNKTHLQGSFDFQSIFENYGWYFQRIQLHVSTVIIHHSPGFPFGFVIQTSVQGKTENHICINHNCVLLRTLGFQASKKRLT
jgi:hypothetical protein